MLTQGMGTSTEESAFLRSLSEGSGLGEATWRAWSAWGALAACRMRPVRGTASKTLRADGEIDHSMRPYGAREFEGRDEDVAFPKPRPTQVGNGLGGGVKVTYEDGGKT